jgi:uncharacterized protein YgiM (DUF1202 family)
MHKRKTFILGGLAILLLSCSLTNGATIGAAILATPPGTPTAARIDQPTPTPTPRPESCTVTAHALNLRAGAATSYSVLAVLDEGDRLTVLTAGDWIEVQPDKGAAGFVNSSYCKIGE